ncbi:platelet-activating factor acetylhydrolase 2, cytoplasmic isoform X2 [Callorhinchus milii]|uniref:platelet-activating factor acetylhydrolase 2, cytoplasmic isoform X2 n=1 Tax=Callorhinchus milii TaxID=7868 RepID=UPI001C3F6457|nr:platelet-activating factor acetylhydrolase 2, cytoplasmic isoform X2 [Callorhinchus milii]
MEPVGPVLPLFSLENQGFPVFFSQGTEAEVLQRRSMGNGQFIQLPVPKGPHSVGCTDIMAGHTKEGSFFRLYYPCDPEEGEKPPWIPRYEYYQGLAEYLKRSRRWFASLLNMAFGDCKVPATWNARFKANETYPVIVFSHGLGAFRDESASTTYYFESLPKPTEHDPTSKPQKTSSTSSSPPPSPSPSSPGSSLQEKWLPYRKVEGEEFEMRNRQVGQRVDECVHALQVLEDLNNGHNVDNVLEGGFDLSMLKGWMDLHRATIVGHSFGGATAIQALAKDTRFRCAVVLDGWMLPLTDETCSQVQKPIFLINSEKFQTQDSKERIERLCSQNSQSRVITIKGSVHQSHTDFTFLTLKPLNVVFEIKGTIDSMLGLDITNHAMLAFLQRQLDLQKDFNKWDDLVEGLGEHLVPRPAPSQAGP